MDNDAVISTLNDLIETCKDGEEGFLNCAENIKDAQLKAFFSNRAQSCASSATELQDFIRAYGGDPETSGGLGGALHRRWTDIRAAIAGHDEAVVLKECERGEEVAVQSYRNALEKNLPADIRSVVERQYQGVLQNQEQVKRFREQYL